MGEKVKVRQNNKFEIQFWGSDPHEPESSELHQGVQSHHEQIKEVIEFMGDFSSDRRQKLFNVSKQCSIHKIYEEGIEIHSELLNGG